MKLEEIEKLCNDDSSDEFLKCARELMPKFLAFVKAHDDVVAAARDSNTLGRVHLIMAARDKARKAIEK